MVKCNGIVAETAFTYFQVPAKYSRDILTTNIHKRPWQKPTLAFLRFYYNKSHECPACSSTRLKNAVEKSMKRYSIIVIKQKYVEERKQKKWNNYYCFILWGRYAHLSVVCLRSLFLQSEKKLPGTAHKLRIDLLFYDIIWFCHWHYNAGKDRQRLYDAVVRYPSDNRYHSNFAVWHRCMKWIFAFEKGQRTNKNT